jgi:hypothetical protein
MMTDFIDRPLIRRVTIILASIALPGALFSCSALTGAPTELATSAHEAAATDSADPVAGQRVPDPAPPLPPASSAMRTSVVEPEPRPIRESVVISAAVTPASAAPAPSVNGAKAFASECGGCHWAYRPRFLPGRSWQAIMADLPHHFGEDASLDTGTAKAISAYLVANAADAGPRNAWILRRLDAKATPIRITDMPFWRGIHGHFSAAFFARHGARTAASCTACHGRAGPA